MVVIDRDGPVYKSRAAGIFANEKKKLAENAVRADYYKQMNVDAERKTVEMINRREGPMGPYSLREAPSIEENIAPSSKYTPATAQSYSEEEKKYTISEDSNPSGPNNKTPDGANLELTAELQKYTQRKYRKIFTPYQNAVAGVPFTNPIESFLKTRLRSSKYFTPLPPLAYQRQIDVNSQYEQSVFY